MQQLISKDTRGNEYKITAADLTWRPSAYGIVIRDDKILLVKDGGKYHLPGGGLELGEDPKDAVVREVREETGLTVINPKLVDANSTFFTWQKLGQPQTFAHVHSLLLYYVCDFSGGTLGALALDEYEKRALLTAEWVDLAKLDEIVVGTTVDWRGVVRVFGKQ